MPNRTGWFQKYLVLFWRREVAEYPDYRDSKQVEGTTGIVEESAELLNE